MSFFDKFKGNFVIPRLIGVVVLIGLGGNLYYVSLKARLAEENLARLEQDIHKEEDRIKVLQAELGYLSSPARLSKINDDLFGWESAKPNQIKHFAELPDRDESEQPHLAFPAIGETSFLSHTVSLNTKDDTQRRWANIPDWMRFSWRTSSLSQEGLE